MTHVDLFSGIGGFALAAQWAGYETVLFCEIDPYCQAVLKKHWPGVPVIGDIRDVNEATVAHAYNGRFTPDTREAIPEGASAATSDTELGGRSERRHPVCGASEPAPALPAIDLLTGGFPCQPFSVAGKRGGASDDRFLWPEMLRVIALLRPRWVLAENVAGIINMALDDVLSDLEGQGYETGTVVLPACAVNAPHRRDRVWIVGHAASGGCSPGGSNQRGRPVCDAEIGTVTENQQERSGWQLRTSTGSGCEAVADTCESSEWRSPRTRRRVGQHEEAQEHGGGRTGQSDGEWTVEPELGRVAHGIPRRVDRLRCLGNAIVPQVAYEIIRSLA